MSKRAVVLAGGFGRRLSPITETRPKPLLPLGDSTVYGELMKRLVAAGFTDISVATMYLAEQIEAIPIEGARVRYFRECAPLGTAGCVRSAASDFDGDFLIVSADTVCDFDFDRLYRRHIDHGGAFSVVCKRVPYPTEYGTVSIHGGLVRSFTEKPSWRRVQTDLVNTGIYIMSPSLLKYIGEGERDFARDLFPALLGRGESIYCLEEQGYWQDIGDVESYYRCAMSYGGGRSNVFFGNAVAAEDTAVTDSLLFSGTVVESGAAVYGSILCENVHIGRNAFVGKGCVIGGGTVVGDGAYIAGGTVLKSGLVVEKGTRVMKSVIFGEIRKRHMENGTVSGRYGSYVSGELALRLGGALSYTAGAGTAIGVFHDGSSEGRAIGDSLLCGVRIYGGRAYDLGEGFESLAAFTAAELGFAYTVTVRVRKGVATLHIFDGDGLTPATAEERAIEAALSRPVPTAVSAGELLTLDGEDAPKFRYAARLTETVPSLRGARLYVGEKNPASEFLFSAAHKLGAEVDYGTGGDRDSFWVSEDGLYAEARLGNVDCGFWGLVALGAKGERGEVALPALCPRFVEETVAKEGGKAAFYGEASGRGREAAHRTLWTVDGNALVLKVLDSVLRSGKTAAELYGTLPHAVMDYKTCPCSEDEKAATMEALSAHGSRGRGGEGILLSYRGGSVTVVPQSGAAFRLYAEAVSTEAAEEILAETEKLIRRKDR